MKIRKFIKRAVTAIIVIAIIAVGMNIYFDRAVTADFEKSVSASDGKEFYLTAHRGLSAIAPENTCAAIEEAGKAGFYSAEFDIRPTKDGVWVIMHDETLDRTTNATGNVSDYAYEQLLEFDIDSGNGIEKYSGIKIEKFEDALAVCEKYGMRATVEIKGGEPEDMAKVLELIKSVNLNIKPLIIDFNSDRLAAIRALDGEIELLYLMNKIDDEKIAFAKENNTAIGFNFGKLRNYAKINEAKEAGITLSSWTVDYVPVADVLISLGVKYITTNRILP